MKKRDDIPLADEGPTGRVRSPRDFGGRSWFVVAKRVGKMISERQLPFIAAGIAFYSFLGLFPAFAALVSAYGIFVDAETVNRHISEYLNVLPKDIQSILKSELTRVAGSDGAAPTAIIGVLIALWGGSKSANAFMDGLNIVFHERESRNFLRKKLTALGLTFGLVTIFLSGLLILAGIPVALRYFFEGEETTEWIVLLLRWPIFFTILVFALGMLFRIAPSRKDARWQWIAPGTILAAILILVATGAFGTFVAHFANYGKTYGALGTVVALLLWLQIVTLIVLLGGAFNASLEYQTKLDSTTGPPEPRGKRGAFVADHHPGEQNSET